MKNHMKFRFHTHKRKRKTEKFGVRRLVTGNNMILLDLFLTSGWSGFGPLRFVTLSILCRLGFRQRIHLVFDQVDYPEVCILSGDV